MKHLYPSGACPQPFISSKNEVKKLRTSIFSQLSVSTTQIMYLSSNNYEIVVRMRMRSVHPGLLEYKVAIS